MPYKPFRQNNEWCVYKLDADGQRTGASLGCHGALRGAVQQVRALYASERKQLSTPRLMFILTSNGYKDRDGEYVSEAALKDYVAESWKGEPDNSEFIQHNTLLYRHRGDPIGDIVWCNVWESFLVEIAKERPTEYARRKWDLIAKTPTLAWGASHGFKFLKDDRDDEGVFHKIYKFETTVLPLSAASNPFTYAAIL